MLASSKRVLKGDNPLFFKARGCLALAGWAGWSAGQVSRHVKCWWREWNRGGGPGSLS